jgi:hypothetical protein
VGNPTSSCLVVGLLDLTFALAFDSPSLLLKPHWSVGNLLCKPTKIRLTRSADRGEGVERAKPSPLPDSVLLP